MIDDDYLLFIPEVSLLLSLLGPIIIRDCYSRLENWKRLCAFTRFVAQTGSGTMGCRKIERFRFDLFLFVVEAICRCLKQLKPRLKLSNSLQESTNCGDIGPVCLTKAARAVKLHYYHLPMLFIKY